MKRFGFLVVALGMLGLNACGGSSFEDKCDDSCSKQQSCSGNTQSESDCKTSCSDIVALNKAADCDSEADDYAGCVDTSKVCDENGDAISSSSDCKTKQSKYTDCLTTYCTGKGSNDANCKVEASSS